jgi:phosphoheptose isomerase
MAMTDNDDASVIGMPDVAAIVRHKARLWRAALTHMEMSDDNDRAMAAFVESLSAAATLAVSALRDGKKIMAAGNGGSAAEAQHLTGEIVGRFRRDKPPLPALCLSAETSSLTAIGNDFGYDSVFARQIQAFGDEGDVVFLLSTSGRSKNLLEAAHAARSLGLRSIALIGASGGDLAELSDVAVHAPSEDAQTVQEIHLFAVHCIAWAIEESFTGQES